MTMLAGLPQEKKVELLENAVAMNVKQLAEAKEMLAGQLKKKVPPECQDTLNRTIEMIRGQIVGCEEQIAEFSALLEANR